MSKQTELTSGEYLAENKNVKIYKPDTHPIQRMVRIYCVQYAQTWKLQIRGPLGIGLCGSKDGKSSIIANVDLNVEQMVSLRNAIDELIAEGRNERTG
jgi:hypothetical protein